MKPHYRIRRVKTRSGSTAIQVGKYKGKTFQLTKHIGSSQDTQKIAELITLGQEYIRSHTPQLELNFNSQSDEIMFKRGISVHKSILKDAYEYLENIYTRLGFHHLNNDLLKHFVMMRVLEPVSKIRTLMLLQKYFDISYTKTTAFRHLEALTEYKEEAVGIAIQYAKEKLQFDFSLVFYDVTTLYFETFHEDEDTTDEKGKIIKAGLRKPGFSKDNKPQQPQILIGLLVEGTGFPVYYDIFKGNTFEGKTIIPVILHIKEKYTINKFTVVADAGMLSEANLTQLEEHGIDYVVGARTKSVSLEDAEHIEKKLKQTDKKIIRRNSILYEYSNKRSKKDRMDNDKQIKKAEYYLSNPSKAVKKSTFLANKGNKQFELNEQLIRKYRSLEGIKGYRTNITDVAESLLIERYKDLWKIEQSFRIAKSDLEARPIYHRKETSIQSHILIVFIALCMARVIEKDKQSSVKTVMDDLKDKWTLTLKDDISGNTLQILLDKKPH